MPNNDNLSKFIVPQRKITLEASSVQRIPGIPKLFLGSLLFAYLKVMFNLVVQLRKIC